MNIKTIFIVALLWSLASQASAHEQTQGAIYIGTGIGYNSFTINQVSGINTAERALFDPSSFSLLDVEIPDIYADEYRGLSFLAGYRFNASWAVEFGYFRSAAEKSGWQGEIGDLIAANTKIRVEYFSVDAVGRYPLASLNKVSLLGAVGVLYQEVNIVRQYNVLVTTVAHSGEVFDSAGLGSRTNEKYIFDTRLQLGVGMQYDVTDALGVRAMLSAIPAGFSVSEGTPYSLNAALLYRF